MILAFSLLWYFQTVIFSNDLRGDVGAAQQNEEPMPSNRVPVNQSTGNDRVGSFSPQQWQHFSIHCVSKRLP